MDLDKVLAMFRKQQGRKLVGVWTQRGSITRLPDTQDLPVHESETRIVLDFKDEESGAVQSVYIRATQDDSGLNVLGFAEYE
jgi:hypothetical protein